MNTYTVTLKATGQEVYRYANQTPVEWAGMEFATHDHTAQPAEVIEQPATEARAWDRIDYLRRLTMAERMAIRALAETDPVVADIVDLQRNAAVIRSNDPDLLMALDYLTAVGVLAVGRKGEILNG